MTMPYNYQRERRKLLTNEGQKALLRISDEARRLLEEKRVFWLEELLGKASLRGDAWFQLALVDRLVELGEIKEVKRMLRFYTSAVDQVEAEPRPECFTVQADQSPELALVQDIEEVWEDFRRLKLSA
jgi:hypothetical protein